MKYIFFGSPAFAATVLARLVAHGIPPVAVVSNPDRPTGRRQVLTPPAVKAIAAAGRIPVLQPEHLGTIHEELAAFGADFFLVAAFGRIIPRSIFSMPPHGTVGIHPSLLPRHRGASPIQAAILTGEPATGVSLFMVDEQVDHGAVVAQRTLPLTGRETYPELERSLAVLGADLASDELPHFMSGKMKLTPQDHAAATFTKKFSAPDAFIDPKDLEAALHDTDGAVARQVDRIVRALNPEPGAWTLRQSQAPSGAFDTVAGKPPVRMKILRTALDGTRLVLKEVQYEGRKSMVLSV
ncbi:MAG: methionyl-tRNA formyltransferase [bacterium]|nr:methionyl-tRNA formyltransferase [bacterium]